MKSRAKAFVIELREPRPASGSRRIGALGKRPDGRRVRPSTKIAANIRKRLRGERIRSQAVLRTTFLRERGSRRPSVFITSTADHLAALATAAHEEKGNVRLLILEEVSETRKEFLRTLFRTVLSPGEGMRLLERDELLQAVSTENADELFVAGAVNAQDRVLVLYRGNVERLAVPFSWFAGESGIHPDFNDFSLCDCGQTICLGGLEVASDAVLYDFDRAYRSKAKRRQLGLDDSFGASLRRLRAVKGVSRSDFPGLSAKEIARIERNEVREPRADTLATIAHRLGVRVEGIRTY